MANFKTKRKKKTTFKFSTPAIEFEKIHLVRERRVLSGISAYELSFMLGKEPQYVKAIENPLEKKRYSINDTNYLWLIFGGPLSSILPESVVDAYHLKIIQSENEFRVTVYWIEKSIDKTMPFTLFTEIEIEDKHIELPTSLKTYMFKEVQQYIDELLNENFFDTPKRALDVYDKCKLKFGNEFHPRNMIKALNFYTNKKSGEPKLNKAKKNTFGRTLYVNL